MEAPPKPSVYGYKAYDDRPELQPYISVVIPLYNEADNIPHLYHELTEALESLDHSYEVIIVDDGSQDDSYLQLKLIHEQDPRWRIFRLRRNFGQTAALTAGFDAALGQVIITMDADLQNDPHDIPQLLKQIDLGYDIVSGWRTERKEPFLMRRLPSMMANHLISRTTHVSLHDYGCTLKAYRSDVVKNIKLYGELHRFIPAIASWMGVLVCEVPVSDRPRRYGKSKYGIGRTFRVILDLITVGFLLRFSTKPLHVFGGLGFILGSIGVLIGAYLAYVRLFAGEGIADRPLLLLAVLLVIVGVQMVSMGLVAEMVMRTYYEPEGRATYMIREHLDAVRVKSRDK
jgi:glycosyltransferase involved in cell wall biosynthesis